MELNLTEDNEPQALESMLSASEIAVAGILLSTAWIKVGDGRTSHFQTKGLVDTDSMLCTFGRCCSPTGILGTLSLFYTSR